MKKKILYIICFVLLIIGIVLLAKVEIDQIKLYNFNKEVEELLADDKEIERKWLVDEKNIPYNLNEALDVYDIKQTYICFEPEMRVRDYNNGQSYELTIKKNLSEDGLIRDEINIDINKEQYENIITKKEGFTIHKTRYSFYDNGMAVSIDIFHDELEGLAYMEIEFKSKEDSQKYETPSWVIKDVTSDIRYKNGHLVRYGIPE